ncbi:unnamed protein product [Heterosigma akashiwo]|uniref:Plastid light harvesting protein n=1 Tax=Heterosigma akashiwo TaxID=2829 RepID=A0A6V3C3H6_HETAK|mmetsp:Transcript_33478/g.48991  ORF Transcript_33478/g.48991 Transcript_33478/m.48991 type:complete len:220 (+) Transcript_33478:71-730(+)
MAKSVAFAALAGLAGVSAFQQPAPIQNAVSGASKMTMMAEMSKAVPFLTKPKNLDGSMAGDNGFDPLKLSEIEDVGLDLYWMREAELKHGRVAMLACAGIFFTTVHGSILPGFPDAAGKSQMDVFWQVWEDHPFNIGGGLFGFFIVEVVSGLAITKGRESGDRAPGDYGFDPLKMSSTPEKAADYALKEVKNGRLAMMAAAGMILQGVTTHESIFANVQ